MTSADLVFTGGPVFTVDPARTRASSLAVVGDRIVAVGHDEVRELVGPRTEVVDLTGKLLLPGFQDAHVHAVFGGSELAECDLTDTVGVPEYLDRVRAYADAH
ncbi:amidohydrolase family protein, partial [Streptomyces massasporeus]